MTREIRSAIVRRDAGWARARAATIVGALLALALTALLTVAAAGSTHLKRTVTHAQRVRRRLPSVVAPAPPLVAARGADAPAPPPVSPAPAPAPAPYAPVIVSGGS